MSCPIYVNRQDKKVRISELCACVCEAPDTQKAACLVLDHDLSVVQFCVFRMNKRECDHSKDTIFRDGTREAVPVENPFQVVRSFRTVCLRGYRHIGAGIIF